jgi:hypothetical protein
MIVFMHKWLETTVFAYPSGQEGPGVPGPLPRTLQPAEK